MGLSNELQIGKAGEHFVCYDLIIQGFNAFLADQGLPFDVLVEKDGILKRIQVKTTTRIRDRRNKAQGKVYKYQTRRGRQSKSTIKPGETDYFAFVAMDIREIAYIRTEDLTGTSGNIAQAIELKSRKVDDVTKILPSGKTKTFNWGKYFEDYSAFSF